MIYFSWATQIILAIISFLWLIPYYIAFKVGNRKYMSKTLDLSCNNRYTLMYYSGFFISILWYIMPFLNQPRFKLNIFSLFDIKVILLENVLYNIILIALIGYFMSVWGTKVVNCNLQATKDRFLHPSKLITEGPYKKVRNPMIMGDLFCHLSFILLLGAIHTLCLYIIYICINLVIVYIENKYSLCIHFKKEYEEYAKKTPAYMNQELWLFAIFYLVIKLAAYFTMDTQNITPLTPQKDRQVSGWLSFFLFVVGLGAAITVVTSIADFSLDAYDIGVGDFFIYLVALIDIVYVLGIGGLALYTILAFLNKRLNAVFLGKSYLIIIFLSNLLLLLGGDYGDYGWGSLPQILKALIFGIVWLVYLCLSEQVSDLFPKEERKILSRDKYIVGSLIFTPVLLLGISMLVYWGSVPTPMNITLGHGDYSDGIIAFHAPEGAICEKDTVDNVCHTFAIGDSIWGVVIGFYDTNASEEYFKECIDSWRNTELDGYDFSILNTHQEVINQSNIMRMQSVKYETRPILIWQFSMLLSPETGKACIVSLYSTTEKIENLVNDLMASVRFK